MITSVGKFVKLNKEYFDFKVAKMALSLFVKNMIISL